MTHNAPGIKEFKNTRRNKRSIFNFFNLMLAACAVFKSKRTKGDEIYNATKIKTSVSEQGSVVNEARSVGYLSMEIIHFQQRWFNYITTGDTAIFEAPVER